MLRLLALIAALLPLPLAAQTAFCSKTLAGLDLTVEGLAPFVLHDPGTAQSMQLGGAGFVTVEVLLGIDANRLETALASGQITAATLQTDCLAAVPQCAVTPLTAGPALGYLEQSTHSGLAQTKWRIALGGQLLTLRLTANAPLDPALVSAGDRAWASLTSQLLPPC